MGEYKRLFIRDVIRELKMERRVDIHQEGSAKGKPVPRNEKRNSMS